MDGILTRVEDIQEYGINVKILGGRNRKANKFLRHVLDVTCHIVALDKLNSAIFSGDLENTIGLKQRMA